MLNPQRRPLGISHVAFRLSEWPDEDWRKQFNIEAQRNAQMHAGHVSFIVLYPDSLLVCSVEDCLTSGCSEGRASSRSWSAPTPAVRSIRKLAVTRDADVAAHKAESRRSLLATGTMKLSIKLKSPLTRTGNFSPGAVECAGSAEIPRACGR